MKINPYIPLNQRRRKGKILKSQFSEFGDDLVLSSWSNDHMLNMLWACTLTEVMNREQYLKVFRMIAKNAKRVLKNDPYSSLCHNYLATLDQDTFNAIFSSILKNAEAAILVSAVTSVDSMPDIDRWRNLIPNPTNTEDHFSIMAGGIDACFDLQSQQATDVRWLKLYYKLIIDKLGLEEDNRSRYKQLFLYPKFESTEELAGFIQNTEMISRNWETASQKVKQFLSEEIWKEFFDKTECIFPQRPELSLESTNDLFEEIREIIKKVIINFRETQKDTHVNARKDTSYGLVIYSLSLVGELVKTPFFLSPTGRIITRTIVECLINLTYLKKKDDPQLWDRYRAYGSGQAALALRKYLESGKAPEYVHIDRLEYLANEDITSELADINIGNWSGKKGIRVLAEEAGIMDIYNMHYNWTSGFTHAQWDAVRDSVFLTCLNPLHRRHTNLVTPVPMPSVLYDCCELCNLLLDVLNDLYPNEVPRIGWHLNIGG